MGNSVSGRFILQVAGKPKETVDKTLDLVVEKIEKEESKFKVLDKEVEYSEEDDETKMFMGFIEIGIKFVDVSALLNFILDYTPNSVEIEDPQTIKIDNAELTSILNDMSNNLLSTNNKLRQAYANVHFLQNKVKELEKK